MCVFQQIFTDITNRTYHSKCVCVCRSTLLHGFVLSSRLIVSLLLSPFIRLCIKRGGLAVCAVGGSRVSVLFCSFIGWGCKWKALCTRSPLFLSSCVLTFSLYLSPLPLSPSRTTHWVSTRSETEARQDLSAQPGPPTRSWRGTPISTSQPIKVSFATHM